MRQGWAVFLAENRYGCFSATLANTTPTIGQPDLRSVIAEILVEIGNVVPDHCREASQRFAPAS